MMTAHKQGPSLKGRSDRVLSTAIAGVVNEHQAQYYTVVCYHAALIKLAQQSPVQHLIAYRYRRISGQAPAGGTCTLALLPGSHCIIMSLQVPEIEKRPRDELTDALIREALEEEQQLKKAKKGEGPASELQEKALYCWNTSGSM